MMVKTDTDMRRWTRRLLCGAASLVVLVGAAWALTWRVQEPVWPAAAEFVRGRVGPTELVALLPAHAALESRHFDGVPVVAGVPPRPNVFDGLWLVLGPGYDAGRVDALAAGYRVDETIPVAGGLVRHLARPRRPARRPPRPRHGLGGRGEVLR